MIKQRPGTRGDGFHGAGHFSRAEATSKNSHSSIKIAGQKKERKSQKTAKSKMIQRKEKVP